MRCFPRNSGLGRRAGRRFFRPAVGVLIAMSVALGGTGRSQDQSSESKAEPAAANVSTWTDADTKLANHYFRLLEQKPEYGSVLDLLWGLYEKKSQTSLLIDYLKGAATQQGTIVARTLYGHLLRKNEQLDEAREIYSAILDDEPDNVIALRGAAEISDQQNRSAKALALYNRLVEHTPINTEDGVAFRLRQAALLRASDQLDEAAKVWNEMLAASPNDTRLRSEIVSLLIEAGRTEDAIAALEGLAKGNDPALRLTSLNSLARLYEYIGDFDAAATAMAEAMSLLHFKHHEFASLFERLVRLHERFDRLPELQQRLESDASRENPSEQSVYLMAEYFRLTANPASEETWLERLTKLAPGNVDYQLRLVDTRMQNDHYAAAAEMLDQLLASQNEAPLALTLLRSRVALNLDGRDAAEKVIDTFLTKWPNADLDTLGTILAFAREHYLDGLVERLLGGEQGKMLAGGGDSESAPMELARFFHERGRTKQAEETLLDYVAEAAESPTLKAARLAEVTAMFRELDMTAAAVKSIEEAMALAPENIDYRITRAEIHVDRKEIEPAIAAFETVWKQMPDLKSRTEIDQRIFSLLRGLTDNPSQTPPASAVGAPPYTGQPRTLEEYRRMAAAANRSVRAADDPPPRRLVEYYSQIKSDADEHPSVDSRYRAAWWAFKLQDTQEASHQLNTAREEAGEKPVVEIEKLQLALAELYEQYPLIARQLTTLMELDPENAKDYRQRWAEARFELGYEDEAIRALEDLAREPEASLNTLKTLASLYQRQGRTQAQVEVWRDAYRRANLFEKRRIIKQLATTLIELGQHEDALKAQLDLIERETDPVQQRKEFDSQLSVATRHFLVDWLVTRYKELANQNPFDRFYPEALARTLQAKGDYGEAFAAMKRAYYMSGQDRELLAELGELAGLTKDLKAAIYYRRQMIAMNEDDASPETWRSLIEMMERDLRVGEADQIRERLETKFTQEADFLVGLAREYRETGRYGAAERVLERLTSMRPWDAPSWLAYGLVLKQRGDTEKALTAFEKAIEETREAALSPQSDRSLEVWPVIANQGGAAIKLNGNDPEVGPLSAMLRAMTDYPFIDGDVQESIVNWLEKPRSEFELSPSGDRSVRLRAIEEAARIHARSEESRAAWVKRWLDAGDEIAATEKLWALRYAGAGDEAFALMETALQPLQSPLERFLFCVVALRLGEADKLVAWAERENPVEQGLESDRRIYPLLGLFAILKQPESLEKNQADPIESQISTVARSISLTPPVVSFLFEAIRDEGRDASALAFGSAMAKAAHQPNAELMLDLAEVAGKLGLETQRREWLQRCVDALEPRHYVGLPYYYFQAVSELYHHLESADERQALIVELRQRFDQHPGASDVVKLENRVLLSLITGDSDTAIESIRELVVRHLDQGRPDRRTVEGEAYTRVQGWGWSQAERILHAFAARRPDSIDARAFFDALDPDLAADPRNLEAVADYEQYEVERVCWKLETLTPAERQQEVRLLSARLRDPGSRLQFARTLEARGLHREAIPVYRDVVDESPDEISPARGFFSACLKANEYRPALELLDAYLLGEVRTPSGMSPEDLHRQHADFLLMAGEIETLTARSLGAGDASPAPPNAPPGFIPPNVLDRTVYYQNALIRAHQRRGNDEATLRVLNHVRDQGRLTEDDRFLAGKLALKLGDRSTALDWWNSVKLDQQQPMAEADTIRALAELHSQSDPPERGALGDLARASRQYDNPELTLDMARHLFEAGMKTEARSLLLLATREKMIDPGARLHLMDQLVALRLENGAGFAEAASDFELLLENQVPAAEPLREWLVLVSTYGRARPDEVGEWIAHLEPWLTTPRTRLAAGLARAWLSEELATFDPAAAGLTPGERDLAIESLPALGDAGKSLAAELLEVRSGPVATLCEGDVERQIRLFGELNDRVRAAEVSSRLLMESETDGFQQFSVRRRASSAFAERWPLPAQFAEAGFPDLAAALFAHYHDSIRRLTWEHQEFLSDYAHFLIDRREYAKAERVLIPAFQKSIGAEPELLISLYRAWGRLDEMAGRVRRFDLTAGVQVRLDELRTLGDTDAPQE
ncbi:MAG: tetratricopeptide repeat protein [Verrucomicrobiae bacterium]|nr:tetratricopeptide repeat protein [Verrucomicrobiae bacterium]